MYNEVQAKKQARQIDLAKHMQMTNESTTHHYQVWQDKEHKDSFALDISDTKEEGAELAMHSFFASKHLPATARELKIIFKPGISSTYMTPSDTAIQALINNIESNAELKCNVYFYREHTSRFDKATQCEIRSWGIAMLRRIQANWPVTKPSLSTSGNMLNFFCFGVYESLSQDELYDELAKQVNVSFMKDDTHDRLIGFLRTAEKELCLMVMTPTQSSKTLDTIEAITTYLSEAKKSRKSLYFARPLAHESKPVLWTDGHTQLLEFATEQLAALEKKPPATTKGALLSPSSLTGAGTFKEKKPEPSTGADDIIVSKEQAKQFSELFQKLLKFAPTLTEVGKDQVKISINTLGLIDSLLTQQTSKTSKTT